MLEAILDQTDRPHGLILTRQNVPVFPRGEDGFSDTSNAHRGGYVLLDTDGIPDVVLVGTGSEVQLAVEARKILAEDGVAARVVSMPCREWFDAQEASYRETVIPPTVKARVSVEAGVAQGWREVVGDHGRIVSIEHYGASADFQRIYTEFGVTATAVADAARDSIARRHLALTSRRNTCPTDSRRSPTRASPSGSTTSPVSGSRPATSPS